MFIIKIYYKYLLYFIYNILLFSYMKNRLIISGIICSVFVFLSPQNTFADGMMMYKPDPSADRWDYAPESSQQAYVNYEDGREKMILSIGVDNQTQDAVWLFPVPANPDEVTIDVITELPRFSGEQLDRKAESNLQQIKKSLLITQIWPAIFYLNDLTLKSSTPTNGIIFGDNESFSPSAPIQNDVQVFEHIEKEGIISEIITAKTSQGLYDYLKNKKLDIDPQSIDAINNYIGQDYSFVISWLNTNPTQNSAVNLNSPFNPRKQKGLFVTFPTKKIFFPLIPTSVYGSTVVPATIRIVGYLSPEIFSDIKPFTKTSYYYDENANQLSDQLFSQSPDHFGYTKIEINAPSKLFTKDLWISQWPNLIAYYHHFVAFYSFWFGFVVLLIISFATAMLVNFLLFKSRSIKMGYMFGFANIFSIIVPGIMMIFYNTDPNPSREIIDCQIALKQKGYIFRRSLAIVFILFLITIYFLSALWLFAAGIEMNNHAIWTNINSIGFITALFPLIIFLTAIILLLGVKKEDYQLFATLEKHHYSKWTFAKSDWKKYLFVPLFSALFVILSYIAVAIISATV